MLHSKCYLIIRKMGDTKFRLGILGGSGLYKMDGLHDIQELDIWTPFGRPSDNLRLGKLGDIEVVFLARHGRHHSLLPSEVPYKANIWAMRSLNVRWIISASAVGSLKEEIKPLDIVIPDQFIDRTMQRPISFFGAGVVAHVALADPFCPNLSNLLADASKSIMPKGKNLHHGGTYLCMEGPCFSTKAESHLYRSWNCSVIGMTNHTEARLAREAEIAYATIALVTDYDCWHEEHESVTIELIVKNLSENANLATEIIRKASKEIHNQRPSSIAHTALKDALMTPPDKVPAQTRSRLNLFTRSYWGDYTQSQE